MREQEILRLKRKCNQLIEITLRLEDEIEKKDKRIQELKLENEAIKARISEEIVQERQEKEKDQFETIIQSGGELLPVQDKSNNTELMLLREQQNFTIAHAKILEMMQLLSTQIENSPSRNREIVVRNLSAKAKIIEVGQSWFENGLRMIAMAIIMILFSIAVTVLMNEETRNVLFELMRNSIG